MKAGDTVNFKSRKWFFVGQVKRWAILKLMPDEKPYIQDYKEVDIIKTNIDKLLKP